MNNIIILPIVYSKKPSFFSGQHNHTNNSILKRTVFFPRTTRSQHQHPQPTLYHRNAQFGAQAVAQHVHGAHQPAQHLGVRLFARGRQLFQRIDQQCLVEWLVCVESDIVGKFRVFWFVWVVFWWVKVVGKWLESGFQRIDQQCLVEWLVCVVSGIVGKFRVLSLIWVVFWWVNVVGKGLESGLKVVGLLVHPSALFDGVEWSVLIDMDVIGKFNSFGFVWVVFWLVECVFDGF